MSKTQIVLSEQDFIALIKGKVVEQNDVRIILADIGFQRMVDILMREILKW